MIALKHILVPTDLSEPSQAAVRYGAAFARSFNSALHLLHVAPTHELDVMLEGYRVVEAELPDTTACALSAEDVADHAAQDLLGRLVTEHERPGLTLHCVLRASKSNDPYVEIVRYAQEREIDLIVMGTHGRTGVAHILMGSVAERVVRGAPCPVLTVHPFEHEFVVPDEDVGTQLRV